MDDDGIKTFCNRCGSEIKSSDRYCMKCGNLNASHPSNQKYSKILNKINNSNYQIGSGKRIINNDQSVTFLSKHNNNRLIFVLVNTFVLLIATLIAVLPLFSLDSYSIESILGSGALTNLLIVGIIALGTISFEILFIKLDIPWWASFIPFYNYYLMSTVLLNNGWLFLLMFVPGVNIGFLLVLFYKLGEAFGKNGVLTAIFPFIMVPVIAYGVSSFDGIYFVTTNGEDALEKSYGTYSHFATYTIILIVVGLIGFVFSGDNLNLLTKNRGKVSAYSSSKIAIKKVKRAIEQKKVNCEDVYGDIIDIKQDGNYYFYSNDFTYDYGVRSNLVNNYTKGYVKVVVDGGNYSYYVSYSDGKYGFVELSEEDLDVDNVEEKEIDLQEPKGNSCTID